MANVKTPEFRVSYPSVFKPRKNELNGKEEYSIVALFRKGEDMSLMKAAAKAAIEKKWGADPKKWPQNLRTPFRDQGEKAKIDETTGKKILPPAHEEGAVFLNLRSQQRPGVVDQAVRFITDESQFYAGCYAYATVSCYAYDQKGNRGVAFGLMNLQKSRDGDPLGGRSNPEQDFKPIEGAGTENAVASGAATSIFG